MARQMKRYKHFHLYHVISSSLPLNILYSHASIYQSRPEVSAGQHFTTKRTTYSPYLNLFHRMFFCDTYYAAAIHSRFSIHQAQGRCFQWREAITGTAQTENIHFSHGEPSLFQYCPWLSSSQALFSCFRATRRLAQALQDTH